MYGPSETVMCGIFGVICSSDHEVDRDLARALAISLLKHSETRGREAAGMAVHDGEQIQVLKQGGSVSDFLKNPKLHELLDRALASVRGAARTIAITGHSRLATNGTQPNTANNQPVITHGSVALHNGIIVNDRQLADALRDRAAERARQRGARRAAAQEARRDRRISSPRRARRSASSRARRRSR